MTTHSPVVASHTDPDDLVFADHRDPPGAAPGQYRALVVRPCQDTWRTRVSDGSSVETPVSPVATGDILRYLGSIEPVETEPDRPGKTTFRKVAEQLELFGGRA